MIPKRHTKTALQSSAKEGGGDMSVSRRGVGRKPGASPWDTAGIEVETAVSREGRVSKDT